MVTLQISTIVPEYFKNLMKHEMSEEINPISIYEFINNELPDHLKDNSFIGDIIDMKVKYGKLSLPIYFFNRPLHKENVKVFKIQNTFYELRSALGGLSLQMQHVFNETTTVKDRECVMHLNLLDGHYYNGNEKLTRVEDFLLVKEMVGEFNLVETIEFFKDEKMFKKYHNQLNLQSERLEMKYYDAWVKHNINLIKIT